MITDFQRHRKIIINTQDNNKLLELLLSFVWFNSLDNEEWKEISDTDGLYYVSNKGRVLSLLYNGYKILKLFISSDGYYCVNIKRKDKMKFSRVNVLVASAFIENKDLKPICHHKDGNKLNNNVSNLLWMTAQEHAAEHKRMRGLKNDKVLLH